MGENIIARDFFDKGLISIIYVDFKKLRNRRAVNPISILEIRVRCSGSCL
jgi:hypothetical protein